ncbi:MAG: ArnT family glycosyltransferase, partial [bacterium]
MFMVLGEFFISLLILLVFSGFGLRVLKWSGVANGSCLPSFLFGWTIGLGCTAILTLFLGLARLLYPLTAWIVVSCMLALSHREVWQLLVLFFRWIRTIRARELSSVLMAVAAVSFGIFSLINALSPPVFYDSLAAHLAHPNWSILNHAIRYRPYNVYTNYPLNIESVYTFCMLLVRGDQIAKLVNFLMGITSALVVFSICSRFAGRRTAIIGAATFYLVPSMGILSGLATHDLGLLLFEITSIYALFVWLRGGNKRWLPVSALLCGFAIGTKYTGLYFLITCLLLMFLRLAFDRKGL